MSARRLQCSSNHLYGDGQLVEYVEVVLASEHDEEVDALQQQLAQAQASVRERQQCINDNATLWVKEKSALIQRAEHAEAQLAEATALLKDAPEHHDMDAARFVINHLTQQLAQAQQRIATLEAAVRAFLDKMYQHPRTTCEHFLSMHQAEEHALSTTRGEE